MLFSSLEFLYGFLPLALLLYFCAPTIKAKNAVLLVTSLLFYGWGEPIYVFLMIFTIAADYSAGLLVSFYIRRSRKKAAKAALVGSVALNLLILGFFKYTDFLLVNLSLKTLGLALPIGISFYTFQSLSYVIDVYRGEGKVQKNPISYGAYVTMFPQLIAGPIVRYRDVDAELRDRSFSVTSAASGIRTFTVGLCKKVLLANTSGEMWKYYSALSIGDRTVTGAWLGIVFFTFQIYFDFSGYSDMATGLGRILGFNFPENFNYPYAANSITDFWRRWHISLSTWFREYVYIPLGGNRQGKARTVLNLLAVWFLTGLWHGASWNYVIWGLYYFVLLVAEKFLLRGFTDNIPLLLRRAATLFLIVIGWLIFASEDLSAGIVYLGNMFGTGAPLARGADGYELLRNIFLLFILVIASSPLPKRYFNCIYKSDTAAGKAVRAFTVPVCLAALIICTAFLVDSSYNPFLYFRF